MPPPRTLQKAPPGTHTARIGATLALALGLSLLSPATAFSLPPSLATRRLPSLAASPSATTQGFLSGGCARAGGRRAGSRAAGGLRMEILGPIGPLAPVSSEYIQSGMLEKEVQDLLAMASQVSTKFSSFGAEVQSGQLPDPEKCRKVAEEIGATHEKWKVQQTRWKLSDDFQARELYQLTQVQLQKDGLSFDEMEEGVQWSVAFLLAFADGKMPPEMPKSHARMAEKQQQRGPASTQFLSPMHFFSGASAVPILPDSPTLQSDIVKEELNSIMKQHTQMVKMGEGYGKWDREGKKAYIQQLEATEDRWGTFLKRFELMGDVNPDYLTATEAFLKHYQIASVADFKDWLKKTREGMVMDAEAT